MTSVLEPAEQQFADALRSWRPINLFPPVDPLTIEQVRGAGRRFADIAKWRSDLRRSYPYADAPEAAPHFDYPETNGGPE